VNVAFRVDASPKIGVGHLMRCLALSEELSRRGNRCYFLSKIDDNNLLTNIKNFRVDCQKIKTNTTLKGDLNTLLNFSKKHDIDWIITDHYGIDATYVKEIKQHGFHVLSVDDTAQMHYFSDILLNQNIGAECFDFSAEKYTKYLLGPKYIMMRDKLLKRSNKIKNNEVKKILVTVGGSDLDNLILKILKLLEPINKNIEIFTIIGPFHQSHQDIKKYICETEQKIKLLESPENMTDIYLESDMAISAGGSTCYELAYFGIPNIIITIADNQIRVAEELNKKKVSTYLGKRNELIEDQFKNTVDELIFDYDLRKNMSQNGRKLVDGKGKERIVDFLERFN